MKHKIRTTNHVLLLQQQCRNFSGVLQTEPYYLLDNLYVFVHSVLRFFWSSMLFHEINLCRMHVFWFLVGYSTTITVTYFGIFAVFYLTSYVTAVWCHQPSQMWSHINPSNPEVTTSNPLSTNTHRGHYKKNYILITGSKHHLSNLIQFRNLRTVKFCKCS
jgi:hypothetical protein